MIAGRSLPEVLHSIHCPIRIRNIDSPRTIPCARRVQGTQNRALSVVIVVRIPSKSQSIKARREANPVCRESPQYCPTNQRKTDHA